MAELVRAGRSATSASRRPPSRRCGAPRRSIRSPPCRASTRSGAGTSRIGCCRRSGSWGSASSRTRPLGAGFFAGAVPSVETIGRLDKRDFRRGNPRFETANLARNLADAGGAEEGGGGQGGHPGPARRWPGSWRRGTTSSRSPARTSGAYLEENAVAAEIKLSEDDLRRIAERVPAGGSRRRAPRGLLEDRPLASADLLPGRRGRTAGTGSFSGGDRDGSRGGMDRTRPRRPPRRCFLKIDGDTGRTARTRGTGARSSW